MVKKCPHCGSIVVENIFGSTIKQKILDFIRTHPHSDIYQIMNAAWADDPNGGPEDRNAVHSHIHMMRKRLRKHGLAIKTRPGFGATYELIQIEAEK